MGSPLTTSVRHIRSILQTLILMLKKQVDEMGSSGSAALVNPALTLAVLFEEFVTGGYMVDLPSATANQLVDLSLDPKRCTPEVSTDMVHVLLILYVAVHACS